LADRVLQDESESNGGFDVFKYESEGYLINVGDRKLMRSLTVKMKQEYNHYCKVLEKLYFICS